MNQSESRCPQCGGPLSFHESAGIMWCPSCEWADVLDWTLWDMYRWL